MVAPHPELQRKINNTDNIVKANKSEFIPNLSTKYPVDYIDLDTHVVLTDIQPWIEDTEISGLLSSSPNIQNLWGPFFTTIDKILVLCVDFSDLPAQTTIPTINNRFFSTTGDSFLTYYKEVSYNKWIPSGEVHGWYRASQLHTYYTNGNSGRGASAPNAKTLVEEVIDLAIADPAINWASFDTNGNGIIDNIIVIHAGEEAAKTGSTSAFWAYMSTITTPKTAGGKTISKYVLTSEYIQNSGETQRIGIDCHEFGHLLNLPDLYDNTNNSYGVGYYSLMGYGCWGGDPALNPVSAFKPVHLDAWSKYKLGFMDITKDPQGAVTLNNIETTADAIKYTTADPKEYFLIENRQKTLFDTYLPGNGLLIWRINENRTSNDNETCFLVGLIQADNLKDLENKYNYGDTGDTFPGSTNKRSFGNTTTPNSLLCDSTTREMSITSISNSGNSMTFTASVPPIVPSLVGQCKTVEIVASAHIEATTMLITKSAEHCQTGACTVTVDVTWRNTGGVSSMFTPTITVDGNPTTLTSVTLYAFETVGDSVIRTFTLSSLTAATHTICPDPN